MGGSSFLPIDRAALVDHGEFVPRSLVMGKDYDELLILDERSES
jgi:hypothetical protein